MKPKKILECATIDLTIASFLLPLIETLKSDNYDVGIACADTGRLDRYGTKRFHIPFSRNILSIHNILAFLKFRRLYRANDFDLIHLHTPVAAFICRMVIATTFSKKRPIVIYTVHGFHFRKKNNGPLAIFIRMLERIVSPWTDIIVVMNDEDLYSAQKYHLAQRVVRIDGIGVDIELFNPNKYEHNFRIQWKIRNGLSLDVPIVTMISEFNPDKRHIDAIRAIKLVQQIYPSVHLLLVGSGRLQDKLKRITSRLEISKSVIFLGYRSDIPEILAATDVLVHPSIREGLPRVIMEAMSMEVPVVAADVRGNRDLLGAGLGKLVRPKDPFALSRGIIEFLSDERRRQQIGIRSREIINLRYAQQIINDQYLNLFKEVLSD